MTSILRSVLAKTVSVVMLLFSQTVTGAPQFSYDVRVFVRTSSGIIVGGIWTELWETSTAGNVLRGAGQADEVGMYRVEFSSTARSIVKGCIRGARTAGGGCK